MQLLDAAAEELGELPDDMQARFLRIAELLEAYGPFEVGRPHVCAARAGSLGNADERRERHRSRLIEIRTGRQLAVGRVFAKKTQRVPAREIRLAVWRLKEADDG